MQQEIPTPDLEEVPPPHKTRPLKSWIFKGIVMRPIFAIITVTVLLTLVFVGPSIIVTPPPLSYFTQEDLLSSLLQPDISQIIWAPKGNYFTFIRYNDTNALNTLYGFNTDTNTLVQIIDEQALTDLIGKKVKLSTVKLSYDADYILLATDTSTRWDGLQFANYLIITNSGVNKTYNWLTPDGAAPVITNVQANPKYNIVAYVFMDDIYIYNLDTLTRTRVTYDGSFVEIINGRPNWMYNRYFFQDGNGIWWSPDGDRLSFIRTNESLVQTVSVSHSVSGADFPVYLSLRYSTVGTPNPELTLLIYDLNTTKTEPLTVDAEYITHVAWLDNEQLLYRTMNRVQNVENVTIYNNIKDTYSTHLLQEETQGWIELRQPIYIGDNRLAFLTNTSGYYHVNIYDFSSSNRSVITSGNFDVTQLVAYDPQNSILYYMSTQRSPLGRDLYGICLDNTDPPVRLTTKTPAYYSVIFNSVSSHFVLFYEGPDVPTSSLYAVGPKPLDTPQLVQLIDNNDILRAQINKYYMTVAKYKTVVGSDGRTKLNFEYFIPPKEVKTAKSKYGLLIHADGSIGQQSVTYQWKFTLDEYIASTMGVVVARVDPRGTGGRGTSFLFNPLLEMGTSSTADYIAAANNIPLISDLNIDSTRVAIWGTGVGAYHALRALVKTNGTTPALKTAVVVDPIIDWREYENIYSEKVMHFPSSNSRGYNSTRILSYIDLYKTSPSFFLIYGTDVNDLYSSNSLELKKAFTQARIPFQTMYYTDWYEDDKAHFYKVLTNYVQQNLL